MHIENWNSMCWKFSLKFYAFGFLACTCQKVYSHAVPNIYSMINKIWNISKTHAKKSSSSSLNIFSFLSSFLFIAGIGLWGAIFCFLGIPKSRSSKSSHVSETPPPHRFLPLCFLATEISNGSWNLKKNNYHIYLAIWQGFLLSRMATNNKISST